MKTIVLPGYSLHNKDWANEVLNNVGLKDMSIHEWEHWNEEGGKVFNIDNEIEKIVREAGANRVCFIAKSIGTVVLAHLLGKVIGFEKQINKVVLCGVCINDFQEGDENAFRNNLYKIASPNIIVFQNSHDPHGNYVQAKNLLTEINPDLEVVEKVRSDHEYPYFEDFYNFLN